MSGTSTPRAPLSPEQARKRERRAAEKAAIARHRVELAESRQETERLRHQVNLARDATQRAELRARVAESAPPPPPPPPPPPQSPPPSSTGELIPAARSITDAATELKRRALPGRPVLFVTKRVSFITNTKT
ncbi:hypothetical protein MMC22_001062 [Lobaria immixta]|nr:hypothetical protein [Lobaria immixta]